jgi:hypothetical protein
VQAGAPAGIGVQAHLCTGNLQSANIAKTYYVAELAVNYAFVI